MARSPHWEAQVVPARKQAESGQKSQEVVRQRGVSNCTNFSQGDKCAGVEVSEAQEAKRLRTRR